MLKDVKVNMTDVELTDENTEKDEWGIGFIGAKCRYCKASLYLSDDGKVMCLNACYVRHGIVRQMNSIH